MVTFPLRSHTSSGTASMPTTREVLTLTQVTVGAIAHLFGSKPKRSFGSVVPAWLLGPDDGSHRSNHEEEPNEIRNSGT